MVRRHYLMLVVFSITALWAVAQQAPEDLEPQRARLQAIRKNAEDFARLRENFNAYLNQSERKKEAVKKLDAELHALAPARRERYVRVLERYADWLDRLKKTDPNAFKAITNAPDAATRLALIREQRDAEWLETQPKAFREQWSKLQGEARTKFVAERRQEERTRKEHWLVASRFWKELETKQFLPARITDFAYKAKKGAKDKDAGKTKDEVNPVKDYVEQYLLPQLTPAEKKQLEDAEGRWPDYPIALVALASKNPTALPKVPPKKFDELPKSVRNRFDKKAKATKLVKEIREYEGPNFARKFAEIARNAGAYPFGKAPDGNEYLVCNHKHLTKAMREFVEQQLIPAIKENAGDTRRLANSEGYWPEYPTTIQELSAKHNLRPPWHILPEKADKETEKWHWDRYRPEKNAIQEVEKKTSDKEAE